MPCTEPGAGLVGLTGPFQLNHAMMGCYAMSVALVTAALPLFSSRPAINLTARYESQKGFHWTQGRLLYLYSRYCEKG